MKHTIYLILAMLASACFQAEPPSDSTGKQSAIEVKSQTQIKQFEPLGKSSEALSRQSSQTADQPKLRSAAALYAAKKSNAQIEDIGIVAKILADDNRGSRHQKFLVKVATGQTLLFAHNIDLAPRIDAINVGDTVEFRGEYEYNPKGGVVHWTHHDPRGKHYAGWILHNGKRYK